MLGSDLRCSSSGEVGQGREEFLDSPTEFSHWFREGPANHPRWESRKSGCIIHNCGSIALRLPRVRASKLPRANFDFHKETQRFVSSTWRFVRPMVPTSRADELHRADQ